MIVPTGELPAYRAKVAMVDGGFDPLHAGHVAYFREAAALGARVLCNVSPDKWVERKHRLLMPQEERGIIIDAIRWIDLVHLSKTSTDEVLRLLRPRFYVKGADWRGRLPPEQMATCEEHGIEVRYLDTVTHSSTAIMELYEA